MEEKVGIVLENSFSTKNKLTDSLRDECVVEEHQRKIEETQLIEENMRLMARHLHLQDQLEEVKRQLLAERSARQGLAQELCEAKERLQNAKDNLDKKKKEHGEISLQLCTVTAERDDLEVKVNEVWHSVAAMNNSLRAKEAENKMLQEALESERKERAAQDVLMSAMVSQLTALEKNVLDGVGAGEQQRRMGEEALRGVEEEVRQMASILENLVDRFSVVSPDHHIDDRHVAFFLEENNNDCDSTSDTNTHAAANVGLNMSDPGREVQNESCIQKRPRVLGPIYQAVRHLRHQLKRQHEEHFAMKQERCVLESHIATLKDELRHLGDVGDDVQERLILTKAQLAQVTEELENVQQARNDDAMHVAAMQSKVSALLHCMDDWCVIEERIIDMVKETHRLQDELQESRREHAAFVARKNEEIDNIIYAKQCEIDVQQQQLEQARHECTQLKRVAAATAAYEVIVNNTDGESFGQLQREHEILKVKHQATVRYIENELKPLMQDQAKALEEEKLRADKLHMDNDALRLELKLAKSTGIESTERRLSLFEALVITLRVLSGAMADMREMAQQRIALSHHIMAYERLFGGLSAWRESVGQPLLLRFRRAVVVVLAVKRLVALQRTAWRSGGVIHPRERSACRIRLPPETCCLVRGGLIHLPPVQDNDSFLDSAGKSREAEKGKKSDVLFVVERDLQLPFVSSKNGRSFATGYDKIILQSHMLQSFVEDLLSFVTVPSAMWPRGDIRRSLSWRLMNGLRALQRASLLPLGETKRDRINVKSHHLLHITQHAPVQQTPAAAFWPESKNDDRKGQHTLSQVAAHKLSSITNEQTLELNANSRFSVYPVPQPTADSTQSTRDLQKSLQRSLLRDTDDRIYLHEGQPEGGFASHVLNLIRALDQRVLGALERNVSIQNCQL